MAAAKTCGLLVHGTRRLLPGRVGVYKTDFEAWTARNGKGLNAAFAFPDPSDAELMHTLIAFYEDTHARASELHISMCQQPTAGGE